MSGDDARAAWGKAKTLGGLGYHPCYAGPPDQETTAISGVLAECNRLGLLTYESQPGIPLDEHGCGQRTAVFGFASQETAVQVEALTLHTDLIVLAFPVGQERGCQIPVTVDEFHPFTWFGVAPSFDELACFAEVCHGTALSALAQAWYVCVVDPQWGREDYLWEHLLHVLREPGSANGEFVAAPSPGLNLDVDFVC